MAGDGDLTPLGREQATELGRRLVDQGITAVYASPLRRAQQTAELAAPLFANAIQVRQDLRELYLGTQAENNHQTREGFKEDVLTNLELMLLEEEKRTEVLGDLSDLALVPGMETERKAQQRIVQALLDIAREHPGETVLAISHGYIMRKLLMFLGEGTRRELRTGTMKNGAYMILEYDGESLKVQKTFGIEKAVDDGLSDTLEGLTCLYW